MLKIAIIKPPLAGHLPRGTGVYMNALVMALKARDDLTITVSDYKDISSDVDIVHFPYFDPFFLTLPFFRKQKTIVTVHDLIPIRFPKYFARGIKGELKWQLQKFLLQHVDAIITDSKASKKDIMEYTGVSDSKITPIYLAPDPLFTKKMSIAQKSDVIRKYNLPKSFNLFVGDGSWNKNLKSALRVTLKTKIPLAIVSNSVRDIVSLAQHPSHRAWMSEVVQLWEQGNQAQLICPLSNVHIQELAALYQSAQTLLFPSHYEGFGLPVVEAFASGCPVITTEEGSLVEITADAALIVKPEAVTEISDAIFRLAENTSYRKQLIGRGYAQASKFSWAATAEETISVYNKLIL